LNFVLKYRQYDANIGNMTTYPYGNFDWLMEAPASFF
jgi:hypothetical protein